MPSLSNPKMPPLRIDRAVERQSIYGLTGVIDDTDIGVVTSIDRDPAQIPAQGLLMPFHWSSA